MPIEHSLTAGILITTMTAVVTDAELLSYYPRASSDYIDHPWREIVDGSTITEMRISSAGHRQLMEYALQNVERMRGGRLAMVGTTDLIFGMFRMWELQRADLDYEVRVFRSRAEAEQWLASETGTG